MIGQLSEEYIATNKTKRNKVRCPSCGGNDLGIKPGGTFAHCWECGDNYRIGEDTGQYRDRDDGIVFDQEAIRAAYGESAQYYHSCISKEHVDYLKQRGIDDKAIDLFRIGFCPASTTPLMNTPIAKMAGLADGRGNPWLANRIVFPYLDGDKVTDFRGRLVGEGTPKYKSLYHRSENRGAVYPYNYERALERAVKQTKTLIITEGEIKALVADRYGFAVTALPGMASYRKALVAQPDLKIVVMYDNSSEPSDRWRVDSAIRKLALRLPQFSVVTLPLLGQSKMDIDTFLLYHPSNAERLQHYIDNAIPYNTYKKLRAF